MPILFPWAIFLPILISWLLICAVMALVGRILPRRTLPLDLAFVDQSTTVCKILNHKGLISDEEYRFEHTQVAALYDKMTFGGYLFILGPIIRLLKRFRFLDGFFLYLVRRWMRVHEHFLYNKEKPALWHLGVTYICIGWAHNLGRFLHQLGVLNWIYGEENGGSSYE